VSTVPKTNTPKRFSNYSPPRADLYLGDEFKSMDYQRHERQFQNPLSYAGAFGLKDPQTPWTTAEDYASRARQLYFECTPARSFVDKRADSISNVKVKVVKGSPAIQALLDRPNTIDNTLGQFLRASETELAIGGDVWWFLDERVPGLPQLRVLRQDFMVQDPKNNTVTYNPGRANNQDVWELRFTMSGQTTVKVEHSLDGGKTTQMVKGELFHVMRFNPLSSGQGSGDGDAAIRPTETWIALYKMVQARAKSGGRKQGIIKAPQLETEEELAAWKANMAALNEAGNVTVLANGSDFLANQLSFTDMDLIKLMERCTRDIALAYQVPAIFANLEGESSYAERRAADRIFYKSFVHPRASWIIEQLAANLRRRFDRSIELEIDKTQIDYIKEELGEEQERKAKLGIYTINELRALTGDSTMGPAGDVFPGAAAQPATETATSPEASLAEEALAAATGKPREVDFNADTSRRPDQR